MGEATLQTTSRAYKELATENTVTPIMPQNLAIYIHWPFCKSKCPYCDFNSHVSNGINYEEWSVSYMGEIDHFSDFISGKNITSIFFGGGTPTLMPPYIAENIINRLAKYGSFANDIEITLEGNPTSVEANKFVEFKAAGVNRVSLGVQSLNAADLKFLGREHNAAEAIKAVEAARSIFDNYSFDLIYARPEQTLQQWEEELTTALQYVGGHMSLYQLTIEKGTKFYGDYMAHKFKMPEENLAAEFYELTDSIMEARGLPAYEVSNYARSGFESRHNMAYWRYSDYLGIGPGAHSRITLDGSKYAQMIIHNPDGWLKSVKEHGHGIQNKTQLTCDETLEEMVMMGIRIKEGIGRDNFTSVTRFKLEERLHNLESLQSNGMIELDARGLRCTKQGMLLINAIAGKLI